VTLMKRASIERTCMGLPFGDVVAGGPGENCKQAPWAEGGLGMGFQSAGASPISKVGRGGKSWRLKSPRASRGLTANGRLFAVVSCY